MATQTPSLTTTTTATTAVLGSTTHEDSSSSSSSFKMRIAHLYTYPIKSIRGVSCTNLIATALGLAHDRHFMLVRASDGKTMQVSRFPEMCLFTTEIVPSSSDDGNDDGEGKGQILVRYTKSHVFDHEDDRLFRPETEAIDGPQVLSIPLRPDYRALGLKEFEVMMYDSGLVGYEMGQEYNDWFSRRFGYAVKLLYLGESRRQVLGNVTPNAVAAAAKSKRELTDSRPKSAANGGYTWLGGLKATASNIMASVTGSDSNTVSDDADKENTAPDDEDSNGLKSEYKGIDNGIGFADCAPFLVVSTKSLENASRRLPDGVEMDISKFRPNIVVEGADEDFEEDFWAELHFGGNDRHNGARIVLTQNCARCASINVDYDTGKPGVSESGNMLKKLQKDRRVDLGWKYNPIFGRYGFLAGKENEMERGIGEVELRVGDSVQVIRRNKERTKFYWPGLGS